MSESRRLDNRRLHRELRVGLAIHASSKESKLLGAKGRSMAYLEVKALHIILVVCWFAGLFYLPRLFVNLSMVPADSVAERERLLLMAGKLYRFMTPIGYLALLSGLWLWLGVGISGPWLHAKLTAVVLLVGYNHYYRKLLREFQRECPSAVMSGSAGSTRPWCCCWHVVLAVLKPF